MLDTCGVRHPVRGRCAGVLALALAARAAVAATLSVGPAGGSCPDALFSRIQDALDAAAPGDAIAVCPGTYEEQLLVTKPVRVTARAGATLRPPALAATTTSLHSGRPVAAAVVVLAAATLRGLDVDASAHGPIGCAPGDPLLAGVFVRGASVVLEGAAVHGAELAGAPAGCGNGVGVLVQGDGVGRARARLDGNTVSAYRRAGIVVMDPGVRALVAHNTVIGDGVTTDRAQHGIEILLGAEAMVRDNVVRGHAGASVPGCALDAGVLLFRVPPVVLRANQLADDAIGVVAGGLGHVLQGNTVDGGDVGLAGIVAAGDEQRLAHNVVRNVGAVGIAATGNRDRLTANAVSHVHGAPLCDAVRAEPACAAALAACGTGIDVAGLADRLAGNTVVDADVPGAGAPVVGAR